MFALGRTLATPGAMALLEKHGANPSCLLVRHQSGDWGDVCTDDAASNVMALADGGRIFSVYRLLGAATLERMTEQERRRTPTLWCVTEADQSSTTLLSPDEY
ncbi:type I restriction endonuclease subunit M [Variovorax paradoxus]|uniref:Type I restriction endonuclease subunit M n=2 Tax=Variovorax paradoxus TaxID=34073 RepID=A0A5Q0MCK8_VARPD|nr:type I restriction endonuclease subunit M [Variovorax paradoxus]